MKEQFISDSIENIGSKITNVNKYLLFKMNNLNLPLKSKATRLVVKFKISPALRFVSTADEFVDIWTSLYSVSILVTIGINVWKTI